MSRKINVYKADPGRQGVVKQYVQWTLERDALLSDAEMYNRRGDHASAAKKAHEAEQITAALINYQRETGWGPDEADEAYNVLAKLEQGYNIQWLPSSPGATGGFGASRPKKAKQFLPGHIVRLTGEFLHNTGQYTGAPINGRVESVAPDGYFQGWPYVLWNDADEPRLVNPANLELDPRAKAMNERVGTGAALGADYREMTEDDFAEILDELVDKRKASTLLEIPGVYEAVSEEFNNDVLRIWTRKRAMTNEEFDRALVKIMNEAPASHLFGIAGVYEAVSEAFNNGVLDMWKRRRR